MDSDVVSVAAKGAGEHCGVVIERNEGTKAKRKLECRGDGRGAESCLVAGVILRWMVAVVVVEDRSTRRLEGGGGPASSRDGGERGNHDRDQGRRKKRTLMVSI